MSSGFTVFASVSARGLCTRDAKRRQLTARFSLDGGFARGVFIGEKKTVTPAQSGAQAFDWLIRAPVTATATAPLSVVGRVIVKRFKRWSGF